MPNPINASGAPLGGASICHSSTRPCEAALLREETRAANNKTTAYWAHNFAKKLSEEEDDDESIFCNVKNSTPPSIIPP